MTRRAGVLALGATAVAGAALLGKAVRRRRREAQAPGWTSATDAAPDLQALLKHLGLPLEGGQVLDLRQGGAPLLRVVDEVQEWADSEALEAMAERHGEWLSLRRSLRDAHTGAPWLDPATWVDLTRLKEDEVDPAATRRYRDEDPSVPYVEDVYDHKGRL